MNRKETQLQQMLNQLRTKVLVMAATVGIAVDEACAALTEGNMGRASAVIDGDETVNAMENEIDDLALALLVRNQPVAQDLRFVVAALRLVIDLERIGDEAVNIAERTIILQEELPRPVMHAISALMRSASEMYKTSLDAFRGNDAEKALALCRHEDEITQQEVLALHQIMNYFCSNSGMEYGMGQSYGGMNGILICHSLNRISRRAANIAEHTYFIVKGINIKHQNHLERRAQNETGAG